jgi:hypothetical protein
MEIVIGTRFHRKREVTVCKYCGKELMQMQRQNVCKDKESPNGYHKPVVIVYGITTVIEGVEE